MNITKKIVATIIGLSMVLMMAPGIAQGATVAELQAQITALTAQLAALQAKFAVLQPAVPAVVVPAACKDITFAANLTIGSTGTAVKCLQALLNADAATQVAATGAGSSGNETIYFGPLTRAAVVKFQTKNAISPAAGFVGPLTRAKLNALLVAVPPVAVPPVAVPPVAVPPVAVPPVAVPPVEVPPVVAPSEGSFTAVIAAAPAADANIRTLTNIPIYGIEFKAIGSAIRIDRVDVQLAATRTVGGATVHPATLIRELSAYDGTTLLTERVITRADVIKDADGIYYVRLTGINFNVPKDATKVLTIRANFIAGLETDRTLVVRVYGTSGIRGVDTLGLSTWAGVTATRIHTVRYAIVGTSTLTATLNVDTPRATTVKVDATRGALDVPMLTFNLRSTVGASKVTRVRVNATGTAVAAGQLTIVKLYDGASLLGSSSLAADGTATFTGLSIAVAKDTTKTLTVRADFSTTAVGTAQLRLIGAASPGGPVTYEQPDLSTATTPTGNIEGEIMRLRVGAIATFAIFHPLSNTYTVHTITPSESTATGIITFRATADGGTFTKPVLANIAVVAVRADTGAELTVTSSAIDVSPDRDIPDGSTATVTVTATRQRGITSPGLVHFRINSITWTVGANVVTQTWGLEDFRTGRVNMK